MSALVNDDLDQRLPWTSRGTLAPGAHPAVVEMVAALSGKRVGRLHRDTPAPPLVHDAAAELERLSLDRDGPVVLKLTAPRDLERSRALHRLRVLRIPGAVREPGPATGADPVLEERWVLDAADPAGLRRSALIEAGAHGPTLADAAAAVLDERMHDAGADMRGLADVLFDAALCGCADRSDRIAGAIAAGIAGSSDIAALGAALNAVLGLWRHDLHLDRDAALGVARRVAARPDVPPDLRGAAFGLGRALGDTADPARAVRGAACAARPASCSAPRTRRC